MNDSDYQKQLRAVIAETCRTKDNVLCVVVPRRLGTTTVLQSLSNNVTGRSCDNNGFIEEAVLSNGAPVLTGTSLATPMFEAVTATQTLFYNDGAFSPICAAH
jgi:hypothetical protein